uniref:aldo/keto reductase n=1 Tax=Pararhizobium sp. IMCC3301 TaxID=3067904 RepID=UPI0027410B5E|nr:aldo/keto reductase [Pararhizobium sp. IMCC3301]
MSPHLNLQRSGKMGRFEIGRLAYGCWRFSGSSLTEARSKLGAALESGANLIDTAAIYGLRTEGFGGAESALGDLLDADKGLREQIVLVTKAGIHPPLPYDSTRDNLISSCEASLQRLKTDRIDVFLIHRPDLLASHEEVAGALNTLRREGKILEAGVSNYSLAQTRALQAFVDFPFVATQPEISALATDALFDGTLDMCQEWSMTAMAWSPLAAGALATGALATGRGSSDEAQLARIVAEIDRIAGANETSREAVALAWLLAHPAGIVPIIGSQQPDRIKAAALAFDVQMTRRDWYAILEASLGRKMP